MANNHSVLEEHYQYAGECLAWLSEMLFSFDRAKDLRLGRGRDSGLGEHEAKMLSGCWQLQKWLDAGPLPQSLSSVHAMPVQRLGFTEPCVHQLVKAIVMSAYLRVCAVVHPGSTHMDSYWDPNKLPSLGYEELENADRFAVGDAISFAPTTYLGALRPGQPGPITNDDLEWLQAALFQEYSRAVEQEEARTARQTPPASANSANTSQLFLGAIPENADLRDLVVLLDAEKGKPKADQRSWNAIAREFTHDTTGKQSKAKSLLAQIRRMKREGRVNL